MWEYLIKDLEIKRCEMLNKRYGIFNKESENKKMWNVYLLLYNTITIS